MGDYEIPWPIVFLPGRYNRNHLFMSRAIPKLQPLLDSLREFENKMRWRWYFRNEDSVSPLVRVRRRSVSLFRRALQLQSWKHGFGASAVKQQQSAGKLQNQPDVPAGRIAISCQ